MDHVVLTAYKVGAGAKLSTPRVVRIPEGQILKVEAIPSGTASALYVAGTSKVTLTNGKVYGVYETPSQVDVASDPVSTNPYAQDMDLAVVGHGATQATGTTITKYLSKVTPVSSSDAVTLQNGSDAPTNQVRVLINAGSVAMKTFPGASDLIAPGSDNAVYSIAAGARKHFVKKDSDGWIAATE